MTGSQRCSHGACPPSRAPHPRSATPPRPSRWLRSPEGAAMVARPVARDWSELFITGDSADGAVSEENQQLAEGGRERGGARQRGGLFRRLRESMAKTRQAL